MPGGGGTTRKDKTKQIRQEQLREKLAAQGHIQHVIQIATELRENGKSMETNEITAKSKAADLHMKLINKYLPDLKQVAQEIEHSGGIGISFNMDFTGGED